MGSLKDQLLKTGLVNEKQLKKAQQEKRRELVQGKKEQHFSTQTTVEKIERDRQLNLQRQAEAERKAIDAQIKQLVTVYRQPKEEGEIPFHFVDEGKVKRLYLSDALRKQLARGQLAVIKWEGQYELIPNSIVEKIQQRNAQAVIVYNGSLSSHKVCEEKEDPYAAYPVPEDLVW